VLSVSSVVEIESGLSVREFWENGQQLLNVPVPGGITF
jgi:hypothetical protein